MLDSHSNTDPSQDQPDNQPIDTSQEPKHAKIQSYIDKPNLCDELIDDKLRAIGQEVLRGYEIDKNSRADWEKQTEQAMKLATQFAEEKTWPWPKCANVKYPLITTAAIQFNARAYPALLPGVDLVKGLVNGPDDNGQKQARADRIGRHMSYQLLEEMEEWTEEVDKLCLEVPIIGCAFRKTYFDSSIARNVSELCHAKDVVYDHKTPFLKLRRITHEIPLFKNDVLERVRSGLFREIELGSPSDLKDDIDGSYDFLEQHCWYDLDEDGYKEPYIVTVKKDNSEVVRIVARFDEDGIFLNAKKEVSKIVPIEYFTKFGFLPNPDGGSYDIGLGILLNPINEATNSTLNRLLDAGTLQNMGGGFIGSQLRMGKHKGPIRYSPGEYKTIDSSGGALRDQIYHMEFPGPSPVLFQLLEMLIEAGKDISSVKDILSGDANPNMTATATLALIEQGQKTMTAVFKRIHRSLGQEFKKLYRLNKLYMQPESYYRYLDKQEPIYLEDYKGDETDIAPVSDPNIISNAQELAKADALMRFAGDPMIDQVEIRLNYLKALKVESYEKMVRPPTPPQPDPKIAIETGKLEILEHEAMARIEKMWSEAAATQAQGILSLAQAEAQELGNQMALYMSEFKAMLDGAKQDAGTGGGGISGVEAEQNNQENPGVPGPVPPIDNVPMGAGAVQPSDAGGEPQQEPGGDMQGPGI